MLMIAVRTIGGPMYLEMIEEMDRELSKMIEDFECAMSFEALCETSTLNLSIVDHQGFGIEQIEQELLLRHLKPVKAGYHCKLCCMNSTQQSLLNQITGWVANKLGQESILQ